MTNPATPPKGGMPKWLIILLVLVLVIMLGCCGGITTCFFLARRAARAAGDPATWQGIQKHMEEAQRNAMNQAAAAQAAANATTPPTNGTTPTNEGATPSQAATPAQDTPPPGVKLPANFPSDVPIQSGLSVTMPSWDNMTNTGGLLLSGNIKSDDVVTYYTTNLPQNGWTQTANNSIATTTLLQYTKNTRKVVVQVTPANNGASTTVMIAVTKKE
jgi:hypothetical protein